MSQSRIAKRIAATALTALAATSVSAQESTAGEDAPRREVMEAAGDVPGVLTQPGQFVVEPSIQFSNSQVNRFTFLGVEILDTFLIGVVEAEDIDRDVISPAVELKTGLSRRVEATLKLPWVYREERRAATIPQVGGDPVAIEQELEGNDIGDVEVGLNVQLNSGSGGTYFIANLRYKSTTGTGPFEVDRDADGTETELPTGSGFHGIEPGLTVLSTSDPAIFYGNVSYLFHLADDVNETIGSGTNARRIGRVDPGDALRFGMGMALSINPRAAFSVGYKHDFIRETSTEINGEEFRSSSLDVGALLLGVNLTTGQNRSVAVNLEIGATADAPDVTLTIRAPFQFGG